MSFTKAQVEYAYRSALRYIEYKALKNEDCVVLLQMSESPQELADNIRDDIEFYLQSL